jgi:hypothetical protein
MTKWTEHVKGFAQEYGMSYGCAITNPLCKSSYKLHYPKPAKKTKAKKSAVEPEVEPEVAPEVEPIKPTSKELKQDLRDIRTVLKGRKDLTEEQKAVAWKEAIEHMKEGGHYPMDKQIPLWKAKKGIEPKLKTELKEVISKEDPIKLLTMNILFQKEKLKRMKEQPERDLSAEKAMIQKINTMIGTLKEAKSKPEEMRDMPFKPKLTREMKHAIEQDKKQKAVKVIQKAVKKAKAKKTRLNEQMEMEQMGAEDFDAPKPKAKRKPRAPPQGTTKKQEEHNYNVSMFAQYFPEDEAFIEENVDKPKAQLKLLAKKYDVDPKEEFLFMAILKARKRNPEMKGKGITTMNTVEDTNGLTHVYPLSHSRILEMCRE